MSRAGVGAAHLPLTRLAWVQQGPCVTWHPWGLALHWELGQAGFSPWSAPGISFWEVGIRTRGTSLVVY